MTGRERRDSGPGSRNKGGSGWGRGGREPKRRVEPRAARPAHAQHGPRRVMTSPPAVGEGEGGVALRERGPEAVGGIRAVSRENRTNGNAGLGTAAPHRWRGMEQR